MPPTPPPFEKSICLDARYVLDPRLKMLSSLIFLKCRALMMFRLVYFLGAAGQKRAVIELNLDLNESDVIRCIEEAGLSILSDNKKSS